jgi:acetyl esterase/lipase
LFQEILKNRMKKGIKITLSVLGGIILTIALLFMWFWFGNQPDYVNYDWDADISVESRIAPNKSNNKITTGMSVHDMEKLPQLAGLTQWFMPNSINGMEKLSGISLGVMQRVMSWNANSARQGVQRLVDLADAGVTLALDIYSDEEKAADSTKNQVKLICMPAVKNAPFVVICPGGAYLAVASIAEGFPAAMRFNHLGYNAFVLSYRFGGKGLFPKPMDDLSVALKYIFANAEELGVSVENYAVCGFSAGGNLAAEWGTNNYGYAHYNLPKPAALILGYPATDFDKVEAKDSSVIMFFNTMFGEGYSQAQLDSANVVKNISVDYPPAYIVQGEADEQVLPALNIVMKEAMDKTGVRCQLRMLPGMKHGFGIAEGTVGGDWVDEAVIFWKNEMK